MSQRRRGRRARRGGHGGEEGGGGERWLLTYADMITLLMALFMVLFSISSVNISKYVTLQKSLKAAFSGSILPGGKAILRTGSESTTNSPAPTEIPSIMPLTPNVARPVNPFTAPQQQTQAQSQSQSPVTINQQLNNAMAAAAAGNREQEDFRKLKAILDAYARRHGFSNQVVTQIRRDGLVIRVLTDKLLFDSGQATLKPAGLPLLSEVAQLLNVDKKHPITVAGHTDNQPISSAEFPSNWELSTARATTVVRFLLGRGVDEQRLSAAGYAALRPIASNATAQGRALNRRVEILLQRINPYPTP